MTGPKLTNQPPRRLSGGQALAEMLKLADCAPMFGMGGFQLLPFYDAVRALGLKHVLINDERCGVFAADAYARVSGRPGVCDATLGPGATNLVTGLVESLNAGVPLVVLIGDTNRDHSWKNMTQEARQVEILRPAVKEMIRVEQGGRIPEHIRRAFAVATSGRPGPVVLDIPEDVCHGVHDYPAEDFYIDSRMLSVPALRMRPADDDVARAAALLAASQRPIVLAGGGVHLSGAAEKFTAFAERLNMPVAHTLSGKGSLPCTHRLSAGLFGRYSRIANDLIEESDCILVVGCKLGEIATKRYALPSGRCPIIHLDIVAEEIGRSAPADVALWGDAGEGLDALSAALAATAEANAADRAPYTEEVARRMDAWRDEAAPRYSSGERPINMARLVAELRRAIPDNGFLVADGGFAAHWTGLLYDTTRIGRSYIVNRGFASIGYGLPGSIGAQMAAGEAPVVGLTGDGGFNMVLGELETARREGLSPTIVVVNNAASGYVKALQHVMFEGQYQSSDLSEIDYAAVAEAMGCLGIRVEDPDELGAALGRAVAETGRPSVVDVVVTRDAAKMLPGIDQRTAPVRPGDRPA